ncbi:BBA14 family lipoprotein [Borrelia hermsii]|uniref:Outer surface protein n=2 Tax=Borrelia hermsii TaxID=140 RepID=T1ECF0_BORHE|nr:BBA14 family lipoprotein [Borrelia hermsii]ADN26393.1 hypothetical protein BHA136 [Borrelia hermsii]AMR75975.1 hypothetical protein A0V01_05010 [Borrelia hermsii]ANA43780.1 putative lipoprotein [Borrelia hermsii HS1]UPA08572.1 hypothetical protein bhDAH_001284 [Borrelia hermsii DAH]
MKIKLILCLITLLQFIILSCTSIASLPEEPEAPIEPTLKNLSIYEAKLTGYALYLETFLVRTKQKLRDSDFPTFTLLNSSVLREEHTLEAVKDNIAHLKHYINNTKPIAISVYKKYSKLKK